jgi:transcriptional regulator of met regulon
MLSTDLADHARDGVGMAASIERRARVVEVDAHADRAQALENAFVKTFADKEFVAEADKAKLQIDPLIGEEIHKLVVEFLGMNPELKGKLHSAMKAGKK